MQLLRLRHPTPEDGPALHELVKRCPPLDQNSRYCNLLQTSHFRDTAILAEQGGELRGFITGYRIPERPNTLFVWQVGVSPEGRGQGLAVRMLLGLLNRLEDIEMIETTVTPQNSASTTMFEKVASILEAPIDRSVFFKSGDHFEGLHEDEVLFQIGPFGACSQQQGLRASA
jgi:L-2,4-diaminobutyric acid acetyltransferase